MEPRKWGHTKSGRPAAPIGLVGGTAIGLLFGLLHLAANRSDPQGWMMALAIAFVAIPMGFGLIITLIVDRTTMTGAVVHPEESVEAQWVQRAGYYAFLTVMIILSVFEMVALFLPSLRELHIHRDWLWGVVLLGWASFGIAYLVLKKREA
ncbi:hypothetical protein PAB09_03825 [Corynebacterium sp. SCR221107]|uniref:hypothetical protein n=1 Tax=Corynebacterium sp. SCR221107 TaxID=3017361 RepID=UPI0022EC3B58|nr:hypothetical protein [Corynebacterium sp. SCR221107]WBT09459.1 hypothetical protein PAB09_03825 [Corynebacterium sp. SCR221107]